MHSLGIIHGDVTANNLLRKAEGRVVVADFGSAHSAHGFIVPPHGITAQYARAPEVLLGVQSTTAAIDVWSLGVVSLNLTAGTVPLLFH